MRAKQEIECQGALFASDGGFRVRLKEKETLRKTHRKEGNTNLIHERLTGLENAN